MVTRKTLLIALVLILNLGILVPGALGGECLDKGWLKCCDRDLQFEYFGMTTPLKCGFDPPIKCCDLEKCVDFIKFEASITTAMTNDRCSVKIAALSRDNLYENPDSRGFVENDHAKPRSPVAPTYLQTLSLLF